MSTPECIAALYDVSGVTSDSFGWIRFLRFTECSDFIGFPLAHPLQRHACLHKTPLFKHEHLSSDKHLAF